MKLFDDSNRRKLFEMLFVRSPVRANKRLYNWYIYCFSGKYDSLESKRKGCLARSQDHYVKGGNLYGLLLQISNSSHRSSIKRGLSSSSHQILTQRYICKQLSSRYSVCNIVCQYDSVIRWFPIFTTNEYDNHVIQYCL